MIAVSLTHEPIDHGQLVASVSGHDAGAVSLFLGTVRNSNDGRSVMCLEYSAYEAMAEKEMRRIADEASERFGVERLAITHRLGVLELGEVSVAIAVGDVHRGPALEATRYLIEQIKSRVPIWKNEYYTDGTREWVDPQHSAATGTSL